MTRLPQNRQNTVSEIVNYLFNYNEDRAAKKLQSANDSKASRLSLICGNAEDKVIAEAFQAAGIGHAFLAKNGYTYIIK